MIRYLNLNVIRSSINAELFSIGGVIGTGLFLVNSVVLIREICSTNRVHFTNAAFQGTATALQNGGPVGLLLGYITVGTICYSVMVLFTLLVIFYLWSDCQYLQVSLGEMIAYLPVPGWVHYSFRQYLTHLLFSGHIKLAERFVDPAFSFTMGWNYWYGWSPISWISTDLITRYNWVRNSTCVWDYWLINLNFSSRRQSFCRVCFAAHLQSYDVWLFCIAELSAAAVLVNYWNKTVNNAAWITIFLVVVVVINMFGAGIPVIWVILQFWQLDYTLMLGAYGECEFIFACVPFTSRNMHNAWRVMSPKFHQSHHHHRCAWTDIIWESIYWKSLFKVSSYLVSFWTSVEVQITTG